MVEVAKHAFGAILNLAFFSPHTVKALNNTLLLKQRLHKKQLGLLIQLGLGTSYLKFTWSINARHMTPVKKQKLFVLFYSHLCSH